MNGQNSTFFCNGETKNTAKHSSPKYLQACNSCKIQSTHLFHPMTHCDVIALLLHCKPMEIGIQQRFCKFVVNTFQNGTPVLRTIVLTALNNPLSVFVATIIPSVVTVIWIVWKSGPTYTKTGSPHCLGVWYAMLMPCGNCWACVMVHMYLFYPLMKREILMTTFVWIEILRLFILYHFLSYTLWYLTFFVTIYFYSLW